MIDQLGGRKAAFGVFLVLVAVGVQIWAPGGMTQSLSQFLVAIGLGFFAGNGIEHAADAAKTFADAKATVGAGAGSAEVDLAPIQASLADTQAAVKAVINQNAAMSETLQSVAKGTSTLVQVVNQNRG
jgi:hypothetical protein